MGSEMCIRDSHRTTHTQAVRGDIGLFSLRKYRIGQMFRFWKKVLERPDDRLVKLAYLELVKLEGKGMTFSDTPYMK